MHNSGFLQISIVRSGVDCSQWSGVEWIVRSGVGLFLSYISQIQRQVACWQQMQFCPVSDEPAHTLLLPIVATGNVGQLAVDILLNTLLQTAHCHREAPIRHSAVLSIAGYDPLPPKHSLAMPLELFRTDDSCLVLQQRAPIIEDPVDFIRDIIQNFKTILQVKQVVLLTSLPGYLKFASHNYRIQFHSTHTEMQEGWQPLDFRGIPELNGIVEAVVDSGIDVDVIAVHAHEGDNIPEALLLARAATRFLKTLPTNQKLLLPESFQCIH